QAYTDLPSSVREQRDEAIDAVDALMEMQMDVANGRDVLHAIKENLHPSDPYIPLIDKILELGVTDVGVYFNSAADIMKLNNGNYANGLYTQGRDRETKKGHRLVNLNVDSMQSAHGVKVILHELVHAVTAPNLDADNKTAQELERIRREVEDFLTDAGVVNEATKENELYGLTDVAEFVAEALSNPNFQEVLARIPSTRNNNISLLREIFDAIRNFLGLSAEQGTVLNDVLSLTPNVLTTEQEAQRLLSQRGGGILETLPEDFEDQSLVAQMMMGDKTTPDWKGRHEMLERISRQADSTTARAAGRLADTIYDKTKGNVRLRQAGRHTSRMSLGWHTTDQIVRRFKDQFQKAAGDAKNGLLEYQKVVRQKLNIARSMQQEAEKLNRAWRDFEKTNPAAAKKLSKLMHDATMLEDHIDKAFYDQANSHLWKRKGAKETHLALKAEFNALPKDAKGIYRAVREFYAKQRADFRASALRHLGKVYGEGLDANQLKQLHEAKSRADIDKMDVSSLAEGADDFVNAAHKIFDSSDVAGPYFPLRRFGDYVVEGFSKAKPLNSKRYDKKKEAQVAIDQMVAEPGVRLKPEKGADGKWVINKIEHEVTMFETIEEANAMVADMQRRGLTRKEGGPVAVDMKKDWTMPPDSRAQVLLAQVKRKMKADSAVVRALDTAFLEMLVENSVRKSELQRKRVLGASYDMRRGFAERAFAGSWALADIETAFEHNNANQLMVEQSRLNIPLNEAVKELKLRDDKGLEERQVSGFDRAASKLGFVWYLFSPSYSMVNATQPWLVALPYLSAKYKGQSALKAMGKASSRMAKAAARELHAAKYGFKDSAENVLDAVKAQLEPAQQKMIEELTEQGIIDATFVQELYEASRGVAPGRLGEASNRLMEVARTMPQTVEIFNRVVTAVAAYDLEMAKSKDATKATEAASEAVLQTQFDYSDLNKPRNFKRFAGARAIMMFKMYAQGMYALLISNAVKGRPLSNDANRAEARKILAGLIASHSLVGGALGGIFMEPVRAMTWIAEFLFEDEDDPWDLDHDVTQFVYDLTNNVTTTEIITRGVPRAVGLDLSGRIGLQNLAFMGLEEGRSNTDTFTNALVAAIGPIGALAKNAFLAMDYLDRNEYRKAFEKATPKIVRDVSKTIGLATEGLTDFNGNTIVKPAKFNTLDYAYQVMGLTPAETAQTYEGRRAQKKRDTKLNDRRKRLMSIWRSKPPAERGAYFREAI
ncbi:MAG: PLxRFG domain-containing protein, partial [Burkholderiaceae bacterium]|nr:PLxRFG domain-containing protein [Burkholderiaceae bacterium]